MTPDSIISKTDNIAIVVLTIAAFSLAGALLFFIRKTAIDQQSERESTKSANLYIQNMLDIQIQKMDRSLLQREKENRDDRIRHESIQKEMQNQFTQAINQNSTVTKELADKVSEISFSLEKIEKDVNSLKDKF